MTNPAEHAGVDTESSRRLADYVRDAWSQAIVAVNTAEEEVQRFLGRISDFVEVGPEEAKRLAFELTVRLNNERSELEERLEHNVRRTLSSFRLPSSADVAALDARVNRIEARLERLLAARQR